MVDAQDHVIYLILVYVFPDLHLRAIVFLQPLHLLLNCHFKSAQLSLQLQISAHEHRPIIFQFIIEVERVLQFFPNLRHLIFIGVNEGSIPGHMFRHHQIYFHLL